MPRYFFHVQDGARIIDEEGTVLPGLTEARAQAIITSGEMLKENGRGLWGGIEWRMWVTDETGDTVCALRFTAEDSEGGVASQV